MGDKVALVVVEDIARAYDFGSSHPLRPERVLLTYDRIRELGLVDLAEEVLSRSATDDEILRVHARDFVEIVRGIDDGSVPTYEGMQYGLGTSDNPVFAGMHEASSAVCGASITAAELVASGRFHHSFNPAGGLHHARHREASGFCIYNDPAAAIAKVLDMHPDWRVVYLDVDVHHGDGVQWIFYDDPRVLTISLHQSGRYLYPGTGFEDETGERDARGTSINVPLLPFTGDADYLWALETVLNAAVPAFRPQLMLTQLGADTHHNDPLANLGLTMAAYPKMASLIHEVVHAHAEGRWVATGGGGYQAETVVPKVWAIHFAEMCGAPEVIPEAWLRDSPPTDVSRPHRAEVERTVESVLATCVPRLEQLVAAIGASPA